MEIETKIFDVKKVRKGLKKHAVKLKKTCELVDYLFDISGFTLEGVSFEKGVANRSGKIRRGSCSVEILVPTDLEEFSEALSARRNFRGCKLRLRVLDSVPYMTFKGPASYKNGVKSRAEVEVRIGTLHDGMAWLVTSGAKLVRSFARSREVYMLKKYNTEIVIDALLSTHTQLQYAEIESPDDETLFAILDEYLGLGTEHISDLGVGYLHKKIKSKQIQKGLKKLKSSVNK